MFLNTHNAKELRSIILRERDMCEHVANGKLKLTGKTFPQKKAMLWRSPSGNEYVVVLICPTKWYKKRGFTFTLTAPIIRDARGIYLLFPCDEGREYIKVTPHALARYALRMGIEGNQEEVAKRFAMDAEFFSTDSSMHKNAKQYELNVGCGVLFLSMCENGIFTAKTFVSDEMLDEEQSKRSEGMKAESNEFNKLHYLDVMCDSIRIY